MRALRWNVLREFRQEIERREDLEVPLHSRSRPVSLRIGKGAASLLLRLVDDLPRVADLHQPRQTKRAARHVLDQTLNTRLIARRQKHRLIDAETAVLPDRRSTTTKPAVAGGDRGTEEREAMITFGRELFHVPSN